MLNRLGESHFALLPGELGVSESTAPEASDGDLGIELRLLDHMMVVTRVESASPAAHAAVRPGWVLLAIEGESLRNDPGLSELDGERERQLARLELVSRYQRRLRGPAGSPVTVEFLDESGGRRQLTMFRRVTPGQWIRLGSLPPQPVRFEWARETGTRGCIGVIRFDVWAPVVAPAFDEAMSELGDCDGVIVDLRGNLGGVAAMVMGLAGYFFDSEVLLGTLRMRGGELRYVANPRRVDRYARPLAPYQGRLAILVDELSASTSEIFAAAMQSTQRARVFGSPTSGQALPSLATRLPNGDVLVYVIADFVAPGNKRLEGCGITPDEVVEPDRETMLAGIDLVLDRARRWIWESPPVGRVPPP
jgi:carboxyl-terminal processing protease